jgi:hypothetical protein
MFLRRFRFIVLCISVSAFQAGCANAAPDGSLAARAVMEAKAMSPGRPRDVALREVSRNLRYADRDLAIEAAAAMSEDYELRSFSRAPDKLTHQLAAGQRQHDIETDECVRFIEMLKPERADAAAERRIRECLSMDSPPGFDASPLPSYLLILAAVDVLPPGRTKAQLL